MPKLFSERTRQRFKAVTALKSGRNDCCSCQSRCSPAPSSNQPQHPNLLESSQKKGRGCIGNQSRSEPVSGLAFLITALSTAIPATPGPLRAGKIQASPFLRPTSHLPLLLSIPELSSPGVSGKDSTLAHILWLRLKVKALILMQGSKLQSGKMHRIHFLGYFLGYFLGSLPGRKS